MPLLEVIVTSVEDAVAAARGGAGRLEVVRALDEEGLTPPLDLVRAIAAAVAVPLRVMVRARNAFEITSGDELDQLCRQAGAFAALGVEGIVCGHVRGGGLDLDALDRLARAAAPCRVTVHRAFEATSDPRAALAALGAYPQVDRVLATGGDDTWARRIARLEALAAEAPAGLRVLPGGGVDERAIHRIGRSSLIGEAHVGRAARVPATAAGAVSRDRVAALVAAWETAAAEEGV